MKDQTFGEAMQELQDAVDDLRFTMTRALVTAWWWRVVAPLLGRKAPRR